MNRVLHEAAARKDSEETGAKKKPLASTSIGGRLSRAKASSLGSERADSEGD
jgi:hypothetical protein